MIVHIGFTGTQRGTTAPQRMAIHRLVRESRATNFHHGDCIGADKQIDGIARMWGCRIHLHIPDRDGKRAFCTVRPEDFLLPPFPYLVRNRHIVDATEALIAAPGEMTEQLRSGTWSTIRYARKMGKPVYVVLPDGTVQA